MVLIALPLPSHPPNPIIHELPASSQIIRIFDPTRYQTQALTFRCNGPRARFDHHRAPWRAPQDDPDRGIYYAAFTLSGCLVEWFGDTGVIDIQEQCVALIEVEQSLQLLDLRGSGAMRAGSVAALAKTADLRTAIQHIHASAVRKTLDWLETQTYTRRGKGGTRKEPVKLITALFEHGTSRDYDPQLHTHALMFNIGVRQDSTTGIIVMGELLRHKMTAGALYRPESDALDTR